MKTDHIKEKYSGDATEFRLLEAKEGKLLIYLSGLRFFCFTGGIIIIWLTFTVSIPAGILLMAVTAVLFLYLLKLYSEHADKKEFFGNLALINQNEADSFSGDLSAFEPGISFIDTSHDFSNDVDLFGNASLFQYLNRTVTGYGRDILAGWLCDPFALSADLALRQDAVRELASKDKWRHEFLAHGIKKPLEKGHITDLLAWLNENSLISSSFFHKAVLYLLPAAAVLSVILMGFGIIHYSVFIFIFLVNLLYTGVGLKKINAVHNRLSKKYIYLSSMDKLLKVFDNELFKAKLLTDIKQNISGSNVSAEVAVRKLSSLIQSFDSRLNFMVGFFLNGLLLWDYHNIIRLEKWKDEYKRFFPVWLEMLGQADAYTSLGNYSFNNPDYVYPVIADNNIVFSAIKLGHPQIESEKRVCNDFLLGKPGTICIVSGANMAGKSTFLRTIAINYILGMSGAPVCAESMSFKPMKLFTSMRTTDSLSNNESYFYAELKRLKALKKRVEEGEKILFILDEILKGTNSADKSMGSKLFLKKIIELGGTGLLATHDTSIGEMETEYPENVVNKCFEIEIEGETVIFNYKLQNGITRKMNAALLMKQMGLLE